MDHSARLVILCGLPGTGKTTLAQQLERDSSMVRMCADDWMEQLQINLWDSDARSRIEALQWDVAERLLANKVSVVVEWGTWARSERTVLLKAARRLEIKIELHYLDASNEVLLQRITDRGREDPPITRADLVEWRGLIEPPTEEEGQAFDRFVLRWSDA